MTTTATDLTVEIRSEDGSQTQFFQSDENSIARILSVLMTPRLFTQPLLTLTSEQSVSTIPCRTIDLILVHTLAAPPLLLPPGWLDIVEVGAEVFHEAADLNFANDAGGGDLHRDAEEVTSHVEIHTIGDWLIDVKLQTAIQATIQDQRQLLARFFDLPVISFRLKTGGVGFINPANISRVTVFPAFNGVAETGLPADLLRCIRP